MEKWRLHIRIALLIVRTIGTSPRRTIAGFMAATAFISAWISNTATAMMMVPIATAIIYQASKAGEDKNFNTAMMLSVAYAASIGGIATLIGTTPNLIFAGIYRTFYGTEITFLQWSSFGFPLAFFILIVCWAYLVHVAYPPKIKVLGNGIEEEITKLGKITSQEKRVLAVFLLVASLWVTRALWGKYLPMITDSSIAIFGAFLLFLIPAGKEEALLKWNDALRLPWDVVLLLGGGLAIAKGFTETGLDVWIANQLLFLKVMPAIFVILAVVTITIFLTEITSNTATATIILPVTASLAAALGIEPLGLMIAAAISASLAFMLPVATPPNAIVYGTGYVTIPQMAKAGVWMNLLCIAIITLFITFMLH
jgi:sodium-dependent dicarboxylate transporter 2/3/5